jgi:hypothetical protein
VTASSVLARFPREWRVPAAAFAALALWQALLLGSWLSRDTRPSKWDQSVHLSTARDYGDAFAAGSPAGLLFAKARPGHPPYPPLVHDVMAPFMAVGARLGVAPEDAACGANWLALILLSAGAALLASSLWGREAGLAAAVLSGLLPPALLYAREPMVDLALVSFVVVTYALWVRSDRFRHPRWSRWLGVAAGLGMLTKWSFVFYVLPVLADAALALRRDRRGAGYNALVALGWAALVAGPWYALNAPAVLPKVLRSAALGKAEGDPSVFSLAAWTWYLRLVPDQLTRPGALAAAGVAGWILYRRPAGWKVLAAWVVTGFVFWNLVSNKNDRYFLPVLAAVPVAAAALPRRIPWLLAAAAAVFSAWIAWGPPGRPHVNAPLAQSWPLDEVVRVVEARRDPAAPFAILTCAVNHDYMNGNNLSWAVQKRGLSDTVIVRSRLDPLGQWAQFVLVKTGNVGPDYASGRQVAAREEALREGGWFARHFRREAAWGLPDGSEALLFRRDDAAPSPDPARLAEGLFPGLAAEGWTATAAPSPARPGETLWRVGAASVSYKELVLTGLSAELDGVLAAVDDAGRPRLLRLRTARLASARVTDAALAAYLERRVKGLKDVTVRFDDGRVSVDGRFRGFRAAVTAALAYDPGARAVVVGLERLRLGGLPLPAGLAGRRSFPLRAQKGMPFDVELSGLRTETTGSGTALVVGPGGAER